MAQFLSPLGYQMAALGMRQSYQGTVMFLCYICKTPIISGPVDAPTICLPELFSKMVICSQLCRRNQRHPQINLVLSQERWEWFIKTVTTLPSPWRDKPHTSLHLSDKLIWMCLLNTQRCSLIELETGKMEGWRWEPRQLSLHASFFPSLLLFSDC